MISIIQTKPIPMNILRYIYALKSKEISSNTFIRRMFMQQSLQNIFDIDLTFADFDPSLHLV